MPHLAGCGTPLAAFFRILLEQKLSIPPREVEVSEDPTHYMRDPEKPLQFKRLLLIVKGKRPPIVY